MHTAVSNSAGRAASVSGNRVHKGKLPECNPSRHELGSTITWFVLSGILLNAAVTISPAAPVIEFPPRDQSVVLYQQANFGVIAHSVAPLSYQWNKDGLPIGGATNDQIVITHAQFSDAGQYSVTVSNAEGSATSSVVGLTVNAPKAGDLDRSFVHGGSINGAVRAVAVQPNGKILIGGEFTTVHGGTRRGIARLNSDGTTDHTFMDGLAQVGENNRHVNSVAVQGDGKVVIAGHFTDVIGDYRPSFGRLNADGTLDNSFSSRLAGDLGFGSLTAVVIQPDDKILICGGFQLSGKNYKIGRVNMDGSFDQTFASNIPSLTAVGSIEAVRLQADHKILIAGNFTAIGGVPRTGIARLNSDGSLDLSFDARISSSASGSVLSIGVQDDGKILIGGYFSQVNGATRHSIARLQANGTLDPDFIPPFSYIPSVFSLALQRDGGVVLGGLFSEIGAENLASKALRLNPDGSVDERFPGVVFRSSDFDWEEVYGVVAQTDGKILVAGKFRIANGQMRRGIARLTRDGAVDPDFLNPISGVESVRAIAVQDDGGLLVGGRFDAVHGVSRKALARLNADGSVDSSSLDGLAEVAGGEFREVSALALDRDGKLVIGGWFNSTNARSGNKIARLNANGTLDKSFAEVSLGLLFDVGGAPVNSLVVQPDGKVLVGGWFHYVNDVRQSFFARLNEDGTRDTSFGFPASTPPLSRSWSFITLQHDGKVIVDGSFRLNADGTRDGGFGPPEFSGPVESVAQQPDGKLVVGGSATVNGVAHNGIARLHPDGTLDSSFLDGLSLVSRNGSTFVGEIALQADGKVLVAGDFDTLHDNDTLRGDNRNDLVRLNPDGTLDRSFKTVISGIGGGISSLAVQSDGRVLIGGGFTSVNGVPAAGIARLWGSADIPPRIQNVNRSGDIVNLTWDALPNRSYRVQFSDKLPANNWTDLAGDISGTPTGTAGKADMIPGNASQRFYRVLLLP